MSNPVQFSVDLERVLADISRLPFAEAVARADYQISLLRTAVVRRAELEVLPPFGMRALPPVVDTGLETINRILMSIADKATGDHT